MNGIFIAVFSVTTIGVICAAVLSIASKLMYVEVDERLLELQECLAGANCGACGYAGCSGYAAALLSGEDIKSNLCTPGGAEAAAKISAILGVEVVSVERREAVVHCRGDCNSLQKKMDYKGVESCAGAKQLFGGEGSCAFGCLGYGDCRAVCPADAICIENDLARIDTRLCTGCGRCVKVCPNKLISIEYVNRTVFVLCKNIEKGALVRKKCTNGCIACGKCVRECEPGAIVIEDNLAVIDYAKCNGCGHCAEICVTKSIQPRQG